MDPIIAALADVDVIALTLYGEARGEGPEGRIAVANVFRNRVAAQRAAFGLTLRDVCLKPAQFSCWAPLDGAANYELLLSTAHALGGGGAMGPIFRECRWIAQGTIDGAFVDNVHSATHYLTLALLHSHPPAWVANQRPLAIVGAQAFYRVAA